MSDHHHEVGVEPEGIDALVIFGTVILSIVVVLALVIFGFAYSGLQFKRAELAATGLTGYPLKVETAMNGQALLDGYETVDAESNIYRIPIDRAMELVVAESNQ
jgi:hypothetical protein